MLAADRNRSRSPRAISTEEINRLVRQREQARAAKDWGLADSIRERLQAAGVALFDKTSGWRSGDGRTGRIPKFSDLGEAAPGPAPKQELQYGGPMLDAPMPIEAGEDFHIGQLVMQREQARAAKDFAESDRLRDELTAMGVKVSDKEKLWHAADGRMGIVIGYGRDGITDMEINTIVVQREKARQGNDFATADTIRDELKKVGVQIFDKEKTWRASDGRQGPVPAWDSLLGPAAVPLASLGQAARPYGQDLQSQIMQAAMVNAANPATAVKTLQMLQGIQASAMPPQTRAPRTVLPPPKKAPAPASAEFQEAMGIASQVQATGQSPSDSEIQKLVELREILRAKKDYASSDTLRESMRSMGIELLEKEKRWTCNDGRSGAIPMFGALAA